MEEMSLRSIVQREITNDRVSSVAKTNIARPTPIEVPSIEEIFSRGIHMLRTARAYPLELVGIYFLMYLFALRITEALATKVRDFKMRIYEEGGKKALVVILGAINLKAKRVELKKKSIPLVLSKDTPYETKMFLFIYKNLIKPRMDNEEYDAFLFPNLVTHTRTYVNKQFDVALPPIKLDVVMPDGSIIRNYYYKIHPHLLRHARLTHLAERELPPFALQNIAGWTDMRPSRRYIKYSIESIIKSMIR